MAKFDVNGIQNAEVSKKLACEKAPLVQLRLMEAYTDTHARTAHLPKAQREIACLRVLYPTLFRQIEDCDRFAGRLDFLPIGFGSVTSLGGVGHYCVFGKLREFQESLPEGEKARVDALYDYWLNHDLKTIYCNEVLTEDTTGRFIDCRFPLIATARLSGMMLDYPKLLRVGIGGLRREIAVRLEQDADNPFLLAALECLYLFSDCAESLRQMALAQIPAKPAARQAQLQTIAAGLESIREAPPTTFHEALQLFWLFALLSGVINYGRLDDYLGPYLVQDLQQGRITKNEAYEHLVSLWTLIENRRTTVNGRIIVGGRGRAHPAEADVFLHLAMRVAKNCRFVEPQFTLRFDETTPESVWDEALDALASGATYPTLYNDTVNVPAVAYGMRIPEAAAEQYVPFGCTEFVIQGQSTGTPNVCVNVLKLLTIFLSGGTDPMDGVDKSACVPLPPLYAYDTFEAFYAGYRALLDRYLDLSADAQYRSYDVMRAHVSFLFTSILTDDCLARGRAVLDGGVRYLGGTNEIYGLINASDSLFAIKHLVYDTKRYSIDEIAEAVRANFVGYERLRKACLDCEKYGNDLDGADGMAVRLYEHIARGVRDRGIQKGMQYFLVVISNNQLNTDWGLLTGASPDGRLSGMYMNPANNPQGGADQNGPTAMLNSLVKLDPRLHAGSVQNIKFSPGLLQNNRAAVKALLQAYFHNGGCHLMVTVVDRGVLEDAVLHPERYPNLIVRVSGFSAVFVDLSLQVQQELLSRVLYDDPQGKQTSPPAYCEGSACNP